jgi:hypothetical protein
MAALPAMLQLGAPARPDPADGAAAGAWARARLDAAALGAAGAALRLLANAPAALPCPGEDPSVGAQTVRIVRVRVGPVHGCAQPSGTPHVVSNAPGNASGLSRRPRAGLAGPNRLSSPLFAASPSGAAAAAEVVIWGGVDVDMQVHYSNCHPENGKKGGKEKRRWRPEIKPA